MPTQLHSLSTIWSAVARASPLPLGACLFRTTEGHHAETVRMHGTDRYGLDRPLGCTAPPWTPAEWSRFGYRGPWRPFVDVVYASTAEEIEASLKGVGSSALLKIPETVDAHVIVYRADAFVPVHRGQYAFVDASRRARAVLRIIATPG